MKERDILMKDKEYISVSEFSELANLSVQAIYKRLNSDLKPYCKIIKNKKMINVEALNLFNNSLNQAKNNVESTSNKRLNSNESKSKESLNQVEKQVENLVETQLLKKTINLLEDQLKTLQCELKIKNKQIESLDSRLEESLLLINQQQKLHAITEKKSDEKDEKKDFSVDSEIKNEKSNNKKNKKWWKFW